jgi:hypothetical protein
MPKSVALISLFCGFLAGVLSTAAARPFQAATKNRTAQEGLRQDASVAEAANAPLSVGAEKGLAGAPSAPSRPSVGPAAGTPVASEANSLSLSSSKGSLVLKRKPLFLTGLSNNKAVFIENRGQFDARVKFQVRVAGKILWLTQNGIVFDVFRPNASTAPQRGSGSSIGLGSSLIPKPVSFVTPFRSDPQARNPQPVMYGRLAFSESFLGAADGSPVAVNCPQPGIYNYFIGNDPNKWVKDVHGYSQVAYHDVWKGVDLKLYGNGLDVEQEFEIHPNADLSQIRVAYQGTSGLDIAEDGSLVVHTAFGDLRESRPRIYQEIAGKRVPVDGGFKLLAKAAYTFEVKSFQPKYALVIDPTLLYSTFFHATWAVGCGNSGCSYNGNSPTIAVDSTGDVYLTGVTRFSNFPTTTGVVYPIPPSGGGPTAFVTKMNALGSALVYSTLLSAQSGSIGMGIAVDSAGDAFVTGQASPGFPATANAFQADCSGGLFVTELSAAGNSLMYSSCLGSGAEVNGGGQGQYGTAIAVSPSGFAYVTGVAGQGFPTTASAFQTTGGEHQNGNAVLAVINPSASGVASVVYSSYLGGSSTDIGYGVAVDLSGDAYITGTTTSADFPATPGAYQTTWGGNTNIFVAKVNPSASGAASLIYSTYLHGDRTDSATGIAVDSAGDAYITGSTSSDTFPITAGAPITQGCPAGNCTYGFVTKLNSAGNGLIYSTFLGGSFNPDQSGAAIALDLSGDAYVVGHTKASNFPVTADAYQSTNHGGTFAGAGWDAFLTELNATGTGLIYSTFFGGVNDDWATGLAVDQTGDAYMTGFTLSPDFPITSYAYQPILDPEVITPEVTTAGDIFLAKFGLGTTGGLSITGVLPDMGGNAGTVTATIVGTGFQPAATAQLTCPGALTVVGTNTTVSTDGRTITTTFNLVGTTPEGCSVLVTDPNKTTATQSDAFTIQQGGAANLWVDIVGENDLHGGYAQQYYLVYGNKGNIDATATLFALAVPDDPLLTSQPSPDFLVDSFQAAGNNVYTYAVPSVPAGATEAFPVTLTSSQPAHTMFHIRGQEMSLAQFVSSTGSTGLSSAETLDPSTSGSGSPAAVFDLFSLPEVYDHCPELKDYALTPPTCSGCSTKWNTYQADLTMDYSASYAAAAARDEYLVDASPLASKIAGAVAVASLIGANGGMLGEGLAGEGILTEAQGTALGTFVGTLWQYIYDMQQAGAYDPGGVLQAELNAYTSILTADPIIAKIANSLGLIASDVLSPEASAFLYGLNVLTTTIETVKSEASGIQTPWNDWKAALATFLNLDSNMCAAAQAYEQCSIAQHCNTPPPSPTTTAPCIPPGCFQVQVITPGDPNGKVGSNGVGAQQWISGATPLRYAIMFANEATATAPAGKVAITDELDLSDEDLNTFNLGPITFPNQLVSPPPGPSDFSTTVDLRPATDLLVAISTHLDTTTGLLTWTFQSLDPTTNQPPTDPSLGFLPIGGEGGVFFTVMPKQGLATGAQIQNRASIVFDVNPAISTPTWFNTLDNTPPTSSVQPLPSMESCSNFQVNWSGSDVGSGVQNFTIFVSDNGGPFTAWLTNTTATSASYSGQAGHSYGFYSIATDLTGNTENSKSAAEATTEVSGTTVCGRPTLLGHVVSQVLVGNTLTASIQLTNNGSVPAQNVVVGQLGLRTLGGTGTVTIASPSFPVPVGSLAAGASTTVNLTLTVPSTVTKFSISENGTLQDSSGSTYNFSIGQVVTP